MKKIYVVLIGIILVIVIGFAYYFFSHSAKTLPAKVDPIEECIKLCSSVKGKINLTAGPCLSDDNPEWKVEDWVCDVAHWPRQPIDNLPENQCKDFREGKAHHFVEVDENCNFIRAY